MFSEIRSTKIAGSFATCVALLFSPLVLAPVSAQVTGATLTGTVNDASGAVIPNAQLSIHNVATGEVRAVTTDMAGFYTVPNLLPGRYEITVTAPGFSTEVRSGVTLTVGAQQVLNITLNVGQVSEKVQVAGEAPAVQLATSSISAVVNSTTVRELPLNGRSWTDLATLQPGVSAIQTQPTFADGPNRGVRGFGAQISISGARPQQNNYRLDGISMNDYGNGGPGSVLGGNLGVDAIQEFSVLTTNYSAEYGKTAGGVVNAITRSGTNRFHGSAYEFLRNSALDARNFFDVGSIPSFKRNQFGVSAGGPLRKDRSFIFGDYEAIRQSKGISVLDTVPSAAARAGNLCSNPGTPPACTPTTVAVDASAQKYLAFYSLPNGGLTPGGNGDTGLFTFAGKQVINENFLTTRIDHKLSEKDSIFGTYLFDKSPYTSPDGLDNVLLGNLTLRQIFAAEETHLFGPNLVNSVRFGYNRASADIQTASTAINPVAADPSLGAIPGQNAAQVSISGISPLTGGKGGITQDFYRWNSFQGYDDAFMTRGAHSLKFGVAVERMQFNGTGTPNPSGVFTFDTLSNFLTNHPKRFQAGIATTSPERGLRQTLFGAYLQDDWRWRPSLTVNLGLRYEMVTVLTEVQNKLANLIHLTDPTPHLGNPFFDNPTLRNFEPRMGFAWDPFHTGKTAVRGGFGLFDSLPLPVEFITMTSQATPFFALGAVNKLPAGSFFAGAAQLLTATNLRQSYIEQHPHRAYVMQWNFNIQRELAPNLTALIGYVGSRGVHLPFRVDDGNIVIPRLTPVGYVWPSPIGSGTVINPNFGGGIRQLFYMSNSFYDALELGIVKRMSHGLQLQTSYTWGKSIDNNSATENGDQFNNGISSLFWVDQRLTRAVSDFNVGRTLVINGSWQLPQVASLSEPASWLVNGWELGIIFKASDGVPFTATFGTDGDPLGLNNSDPWDFPNRLTGPGCAKLVNPGNPNNYIKTQCFAVPTAPSAAFYTANCDPTVGTFPQCFNLRGNSGRNVLTGPGTSNLDFSVFKNNYIKRISENFNAQFRAEFFNILNHANFAVPVTPNNTDIFDSTGAPAGAAGLLTSTTTTAREIQFALKVIW
jgi:hypothetical protein